MKELAIMANNARVMRTEPCSCVLMQMPKCAICDENGNVQRVDWQATTLKLERELAAAQAKSVTEEDTLAPIADCVASAHRNSNLPSPEFRPLTLDVVRERIWELSYEANRLRLQLSRPRAAGVSEDVLKIAREVLEEPSARANVRATLASTFGRATAGMVDDLEKMARELLRLHAILAGEGK